MTRWIPLPFLIALILALSACTTTPQAPLTIEKEVPPSLLVCAPSPSPPVEDGITQRDVARFLLDLAEAGEDCRSKLGSVKRLLSE